MADVAEANRVRSVADIAWSGSKTTVFDSNEGSSLTHGKGGAG